MIPIVVNMNDINFENISQFISV